MPATNTIPRPKWWLAEYNRLYPKAWQMADHFRSLKGRDPDLDKWPDWCYLPIAATCAIVEAQHGMPIKEFLKAQSAMNRRFADTAAIAALYAWRATQNIYRFDVDLMTDLANTPLEGDIPHEILYRLPDWCVYIDLNPDNMFDEPIQGLFAHLEYDLNEDRTELRFIVDVDDPTWGNLLVPVPIHLGPWSMAEAVDRARQETERHAQAMDTLPAAEAKAFWDALAGPVSS